jgi:hypothetical protein
VGSGYVGLVAGACFADLGHEVVLVDNDQAKVSALQAGSRRTPGRYEKTPGDDCCMHEAAKVGRPVSGRCSSMASTRSSAPHSADIADLVIRLDDQGAVLRTRAPVNEESGDCTQGIKQLSNLIGQQEETGIKQGRF